jgi:hypothetical protein
VENKNILMRRFKGFEVVTQKTILTAVTVFFIILALVFLFTEISQIFKPKCWDEPTGKLINLKNGDNVVDFMGCVEKAIFTNDLNAVRDEIDIYKYCHENYRLSGEGSFLIIIPDKEPQISATWKALDFITRGELLKPWCLWREYGLFGETTVVFEGSDERHCIHVEEYKKDPPIKLIAGC